VIDTKVMAGIQAQITNGSVKKEQSQYVTDDETSQFWDELAEELANAPKGAVYEIVRE